MLAAKVLHRQAGFRLTQEADDLLFGKALLHVQSPSDGGLDSKPQCYSKAGGRRTTAWHMQICAEPRVVSRNPEMKTPNR
ncbi:hypothetical protein MBSD_n2179 [Mizugakiibacter sediminis]|uniref:Uncharacterized protein n=1 Tax=Mizugakiibacter sediminis TaxID=1475481 RepID=A0A0K8QPN7_9GAMM|nr:hypothetical protein MBSD_n2179 [Mizugakiibacter sediminis]